MRYSVFAILTAVLAFLPVGVYAHMTDLGSNTSPGFMMMQQLEDQAIGNDALHEEMENLMAKMMSGSMSDAETNRMVALMQEYPSPMSMMLARQSLGDGGMGRMLAGQGNFGGMMGYGWGNQPGQWIFWVTTILVWIFLLLAIAFLGQRVQKR